MHRIRFSVSKGWSCVSSCCQTAPLDESLWLKETGLIVAQFRYGGFAVPFQCSAILRFLIR